MLQRINAHKTCGRVTKRKILFGRFRLEDNIKMDSKYFERMKAELICLTIRSIGRLW
jgi:hypothetical protein